MTANEFSRKASLFSKKFALNVTIAVEDEDALQQEMRLAKETILGWSSDRGRTAELIMFTIVAPEQIHQQIINFVRRTARVERDLAPIFRRIPGELHVLDETENAKTFALP